MKFKTLAFIAASSAMTLPAFAADYDITATDTLFGTDISNAASLSYVVGAATINEVSPPVVFTVDRKVIFSVTDNLAATPVAVLAGGVATTIYTLQNDSNAPVSFKLPIPPVGTTYSYGTGPVITITSATSPASADLIIDLLAGDFVTPETVEITMSVDVADTANSGDPITTSLVLIAVEPATDTNIGSGVTAGDPIIATLDSVVWDKDVIQTVSIPALLDGTSVTLTSDQAFTVSASDLSIVKTVAILSDPINLTTNPKAIPGAVVEYTLTITNAGLVTATGVDLSDDVPAAFDLTDTYVETYTLDAVATVPGIVGNTLSFNSLSIPAATDISLPATYGETVIRFTVKLP
jgi:uncharacterized repeat protein (TIGR01451 family)